jgi:hypothetical protein
MAVGKSHEPVLRVYYPQFLSRSVLKSYAGRKPVGLGESGKVHASSSGPHTTEATKVFEEQALFLALHEGKRHRTVCKDQRSRRCPLDELKCCGQLGSGAQLDANVACIVRWRYNETAALGRNVTTRVASQLRIIGGGEYLVDTSTDKTFKGLEQRRCPLTCTYHEPSELN